MDFQTALDFVNSIVATKAKRNLRSPEIAILEGTWKGMTYEQMADSTSYSTNYLMRDIGPKFWKLLSEILAENVTKNNIRVVLNRAYASFPQSSKLLQNPPDSEESKFQLPKDREVADRVRQFYDREQELSLLLEWVTVDKSRLIGLWGLSGVGKTVLVKKFAEQVQDEFEIVIWRSLSDAPTLKELTSSLLPSSFSIEHEGRLLSQLLEFMRSHSCLIVLDDIEAILQPGELSGKYRSGYENYGDLFRHVGNNYHQSCLILSGLESPGGIFQIEQHNSVVHSLKMSGLTMAGAKLFLEEGEELLPSASWSKLIEYYQGNPAILSIAAKIIKELFNGNVEEFWAQDTLVLGGINQLLDKTLQRLTVLETEILYWLIVESKPISLAEIKQNIPLSIYPLDLIEALESLKERSLVEVDMLEQRSVIVVPPIIKELVTNSLIAQIGSQSTAAEQPKRIVKEQKTIELSLSSQKPTYLSQWLQNSFDLDWHPIEAIFTVSEKLPFRLRSAYKLRESAWVKRFKQIELAAEKISILLLVAINQEKQSCKICVQAQPALEQQTLPNNLCLSLSNEGDRILAETTAKTEDNLIQLPYFRGVKAERFKIGLTLNSAEHHEEFII
ncbi:MAG: DUF1822 family protein [Cyanobacteria bacterium J06631_2]